MTHKIVIVSAARAVAGTPLGCLLGVNRDPSGRSYPCNDVRFPPKAAIGYPFEFIVG
jgi:hypothetical protein